MLRRCEAWTLAGPRSRVLRALRSGRQNRPASGRWVWLSLLPLGLGAWAPAIAGDRCGVRRWTVLGLFWPAVALGGWVLTATSSKTDKPAVAGLLMLAGWIGGIATSFAIRSEYEDRRSELPAAPSPWPRPTARSRTWTVQYAIVAFIATFGGDIVLGLLLRHVFGIHLQVWFGVLIVDATLLAGLVPLALSRGLSFRDLGLQPTPPIRSLGLVLSALLIYVVVAALYTLAFIGHSTQKSADILSQVGHVGTFETVIAVVAIAVSAPVVEEIFFRGLIYRSLRNHMPAAWAALLGGSLFGLVHIIGYPLITVPIKGLFGILACLLYERTGSIIPGIALHSFVDASAVDVALTGNDDIVLTVFGVTVAILILRWAVVSLAQASGRALRVEEPIAQQ